jgi:hypothetical protein
MPTKLRPKLELILHECYICERVLDTHVRYHLHMRKYHDQLTHFACNPNCYGVLHAKRDTGLI